MSLSTSQPEEARKGAKRLPRLAIIAVAAVIITLVNFLALFGNMTYPISDTIEDGGAVEHQLRSFGRSRFSISITSTYDKMNVKILVDGSIVYERTNIQECHFQYSMSLGDHIIRAIITNPSFPGLGSAIQVSGMMSIGLW